MSTQTPNQLVKLTKSVVDRTTPPASGQRFIRDREIKGFALRITASGVRSFIVEKRIEGRVRRLTLGRYPDLTAEQARKEALRQLGEIATGKDPVAEAQQRRRERTTLDDAFRDFLKARKNLKERTLYDYRRLMAVAFADWQRKPLKAITKDLVAKRHAELGSQRGEAYANLAMRFLRSLFNFALAEYEDRNGVPVLPYNPVDRLNKTRSWYRIERRQTVIKPHELSNWYRAVEALRSDDVNAPGSVVADYLLLLLFTGLRRQEGMRLQWVDVDLLHRTLTVRDTKNGEPLVLPLTDHVAGLLEARRQAAVCDHVFPGREWKDEAGQPARRGRLQEPRPQMRRVIEASGVAFTLHDLRRTFVTTAEGLDISAYAVKRLVNHKMRNDVTAGYIVSDVERLRGPMQQISDYFLRAMGVEATPVIPLRRDRTG